MKAPDLKKCPKVLVVEGYSDLTFLRTFLQRLGREEGVFIKDMGGREKLIDELTTFIDENLLAKKSHVAVILDADDDGTNFTQRLKTKLDELTGRDLTEGQWSDGGLDAKVGFFVAPRPGEVGELEDLVWQAVAADPAHSAEVRCIDEFLACMNAGPTEQNRRIAKRRLGSLFAVRHEDDPRLGPAARAGHIDFDAPALARLRNFLEGF